MGRRKKFGFFVLFVNNFENEIIKKKKNMFQTNLLRYGAMIYGKSHIVYNFLFFVDVAFGCAFFFEFNK